MPKPAKKNLPIVDDDFNLKGLITIKDIEKQIKYPLAAKDAQGRLLCGAAVGITANVLARVDALVKANVDVSRSGLRTWTFRECPHVQYAMIKDAYPDLQVIAGNVATGAATKALIDAGVDAVKVGIGPGSICTTRVVAGIGVPQITAVMDCYEVANRVWYPDHRRWRNQILRRYDQGDRSRCQCLHDGKHVCRMRREPGNFRTVPGT